MAVKQPASTTLSKPPRVVCPQRICSVGNGCDSRIPPGCGRGSQAAVTEVHTGEIQPRLDLLAKMSWTFSVLLSSRESAPSPESIAKAGGMQHHVFPCSNPSVAWG